MPRSFFFAVLLTWAAAGAGCVTEEIAPEDVAVAASRLVVARSGSVVHLSWQSQSDLTYTLLFSDRRDARARWRPLPEASNLRGTGGPMNFTDQVPANQARYYRLQMGHAR